MKEEDIKNLHYNNQDNQNEIQFEYGGQRHHYKMKDIAKIICGYWNYKETLEQQQFN